MYLENQESVREKSGKSQGEKNLKVCGNPVRYVFQGLTLSIARLPGAGRCCVGAGKT